MDLPLFLQCVSSSPATLPSYSEFPSYSKVFPLSGEKTPDVNDFVHEIEIESSHKYSLHSTILIVDDSNINRYVGSSVEPEPFSRLYSYDDQENLAQDGGRKGEQ